jgi:hypothetical protein
METPQERMLDAGRRVQVFLDTFVALLAGLIPASLRAKLDAAVTMLAGFRQEQKSAAGLVEGETANQAKLRLDLYEHFVLPNVRTAKLLIGDLTQYPSLIVPKSVVDSVDFVPTIQKFRDAATKQEAMFTQHGMPADFLAQIDAALTAVQASADFRARQIARRKAATDGCADGFRQVRGYVGIIDGLLRPMLKTNPSLNRDWQASKSIRKTPVTPQPTGSLSDPTAATDAGGGTDTTTGGPAAAASEGTAKDTGTPVKPAE